MKLKSEVIGGVVTGLYLLLIAALVYWKWDTVPKLELNELGDFLAGVFGPIAFLWLILGYLQQGRELRLSSEALHLQAKELENSVVQQAHLVSVGREQITAQTEALNQAKRQYEQSMNARFVFYPGPYMVSNTQVTNTFEISNVGADAFDVMFLSGLREINFRRDFEVLREGQTVSVKLNFELFAEDCHGALHCFYKTRDGRRISFDMDLSLIADTRMATITPEVKVEDL